MAGAKPKGRVSVEGKDSVVQHDDVVVFASTATRASILTA